MSDLTSTELSRVVELFYANFPHTYTLSAVLSAIEHPSLGLDEKTRNFVKDAVHTSYSYYDEGTSLLIHDAILDLRAAVSDLLLQGK